MALADPEPPQPEPLQIVGVTRVPGQLGASLDWRGLLFTFNRKPTDEEMRSMHDLPPSFVIMADARRFYDRMTLAELAVRLFRTLILGKIIVEDTPAAMDWLKDWIDGTHRGHGPIGNPMVWPDRLTFVANLLREWGFQPTPTLPPYVAKKPAPTETGQDR